MPMLGPSLLTARLRAEGLTASVVYANLLVAQEIGLKIYEDIADSDVRLLLGEILCALSDPDWFSKDKGPLATTCVPSKLSGVAPAVGKVLDRCATLLASMQPRIIGFSSSFQQSVACVLLARRLRRLLPSALIVVGGSNVDSPMGDAFASRFHHEFDHVFSGEADVTFPDYCRAYRLDFKNCTFPKVIKASLPNPTQFAGVPDFDDYFRFGGVEAQQVLLGERVLPFEMSRGCWWGEKHHCTFCGLNANGMHYRVKAPCVVEEEIKSILAQHSPKQLFAVDNILSRRALTIDGGLPPGLGNGFRYFFESKSNLSEADLDQLVALGIDEIQPGIESLSTSTLKRLRKGNSGAAHLCLLREASSRQIKIFWNLLVDIPGDDASGYQAMASVIPLLMHLQPPSGCTPIRIDRFSPLFESPAAFDLRNIRPIRAFSLLFGDEPDVRQMSYFFEADYCSAFRDKSPAVSLLEQLVGLWQKSWSDPYQRRSLVGVRNRNGEYIIVGQAGKGLPKVTIVPPEDERLLSLTRRPLAASVLSADERARLDHYVDLKILAFFEEQYVFLPSEPWRGLMLRSSLSSTLANENTCYA